MSTRVLATIAILLGLVCVAVAVLTCVRLGYTASPATPEVVLENGMLSVRQGQRVILRPLLEGATEVRYWFGPKVCEPRPDDSISVQPHIRAGLEDRRAGEDTWYFVQAQSFVMAQLGALTEDEWLEEIRPVREQLPDGSERVVMRATFGHETGAFVYYFYDPQNPVPGFGWYRHELYAQGAGQQVYLAIPAN